MNSLIRTLLVAVTLCASAAFADTNAPATSAASQQEAQKAEVKAAIRAANDAMVEGPKEIAIRDQAKFSLPAGMGWIPDATAVRLLRAMGNSVDGQSVVGIVVPTSGDGDWLNVISYVADGYVRDDDARDWKANDILDSLRKGTEEGNATRREHGLPEMEVTGWAQTPQYDGSTHRLVWAARIVDKPVNGVADDDPAVNYRTMALGREGYLSTTLVTGEATLGADKPAANKILAGLNFLDGKRYADFNEKTDHVAEYGLAALVAGVAAKKLGLFALIAAFVLKFAKVGIIALLGVGAAVRKFFKRKPKAEAPAKSSTSSASDTSTPSTPSPAFDAGTAGATAVAATHAHAAATPTTPDVSPATGSGHHQTTSHSSSTSHDTSSHSHASSSFDGGSASDASASSSSSD